MGFVTVCDIYLWNFCLHLRQWQSNNVQFYLRLWYQKLAAVCDTFSLMKSLETAVAFIMFTMHWLVFHSLDLWPSVLWRCWLGGRKGIRPVKNLSGEVLAWLSVWNKVQTCIWLSWCHCHSLSLASVKSRLVLSFWYWPTRVVRKTGR